MPEVKRKSPNLGPEVDLGSFSRDASIDLLLGNTDADVQTGALKVFGHRYLLLRPETLVNLQKQLEQTVGASTKGFLYLAGEKSAKDGHHVIDQLLEGVDPSSSGPEALKRIADIGALLGWGRFEIVSMDLESARFTLALAHSPIAAAYGPSKKPVCHFLAGWLAGIAHAVVDQELLCEETACAAQGHTHCEFQVRAMPFG